MTIVPSALLVGCGGGGGSDNASPATLLPASVSVVTPRTVEVASAVTLNSDLPATVNGLQISWDFGDGTQSGEVRPAHSYAAPGVYVVRLTVRDAAGRQVGAQATVQAGYYARLQGLRCSGGDAAGWCRQLPLPWSPLMRDLLFTDASNGWIVGDGGTILQTRDGGLTWNERVLAGGPSLSKISFATARSAWLLGTDGSGPWRSDDGGASWSAVTPVPVDFPSRIATLGEQQALVWGKAAGSAPAWTEDGGLSWRLLDRDVRHVETDGTLWGVPVTPPGQSFQAYPGVPYAKSLDRGRSFVSESAWPAGGVVDWMGLAESGWAWAVSSTWKADGSSRTLQLLTRRSQGGSWTATDLPVIDADSTLAKIMMTPSGSWALAYRPTACCKFGLSHSGNGGLSWTKPSWPDGLSDLQIVDTGFIDGQTMYVQVNRNGWPYVTADAGRSWSLFQPGQALPDGNTFAALQRDPGGLLLQARRSEPYYVAAQPSWFRSRDSGKSWSPLWAAQPYAGTISEIWFLNSRKGLAVTETGAVLDSDDGGRNWRARAAASLPAGGSDGLRRLRFLANGSGWAIAAGKLYRSADQGLSWTLQPTPIDVTNFEWLDATRVLTATTSCSFSSHSPKRCTSTLYRSDDAALTWRSVATSTPPGDCARMLFISATQGLCGGIGGLSYTSDGGLTWKAATGPALDTATVQQLRSTGSGVVWCLTTTGLLRSDDGGQTWRSVTLPTLPSLPADDGSARQALLNDLVFAGTGKGWIVGDWGVVLYTEDGGGSWTRQATAVQSKLTAAFALDAATLWLGADGSILATATGGR